eukprot:1156863-Pelagomonas_calceolata.AAC.8
MRAFAAAAAAADCARVAERGSEGDCGRANPGWPIGAPRVRCQGSSQQRRPGSSCCGGCRCWWPDTQGGRIRGAAGQYTQMVMAKAQLCDRWQLQGTKQLLQEPP